MKSFRIGHGYDIHRTAQGRRLVLGGVEIAGAPFGLDGHSDADCLCHALADAILGAAALPDIGHYFPPGKPEIAGIDSKLIVAKAVAEARHLGWKVVNADCTLVAEKPKIAPHIAAMKEALSRSLGVTAGDVGIKATTNEKLGALGRQEGIAAFAVVLLGKAD